MSRRRTTAAAVLVLLAAWAWSATAGAAVPRLVFPVVAQTSYTNDFGAPRWQGRHDGNDLMAAKRSPVVAVEAGRVTKWTSSRSAGCMLYLYGASGTTYYYVHLNNDRTLRNDNRGGCRNKIAYAPGLRSGDRVQAGQLIGYVGDSGDANGIASHLHFEVRPKSRAVSPFKHLRSAHRILYPRPPASMDVVEVKIYGTVAATRPDLDPRRVRIKVTRVVLPNGWDARPARNVSVSVSAETTFRRAIASGVSKPATFEELEPGLKVIAWTSEVPQTLWTARALSGRLVARDILIRKNN